MSQAAPATTSKSRSRDTARPRPSATRSTPRSANSRSAPRPGATSPSASARDSWSACTPPCRRSPPSGRMSPRTRRASRPGIRCAARTGSRVRTAWSRRSMPIAATLLKLAKGESPLTGVKTDAAPGGRVRAHVFPLRPVDGLLLSGFTGEVWFEPGVTDEEARRTAGLAQREPTTAAASDSCSARATSARSRCSTSSTNCWRTTASPCSSSIPRTTRSRRCSSARSPRSSSPGFVRIVRGGPDVGEYLTGHPGIVHVHITGAAPTFDAIVWGAVDRVRALPPPRKRKRENRPKLEKPITAELGGVSPIIVVPGYVDRRRPALPGRARRHDAAAELRPQLHRRAGRAPERRLGAARCLPRRPACGVRGGAAARLLVPPERREARGSGIRLSRCGLVLRRNPRDRRDPRRRGRRPLWRRPSTSLPCSAS